MVDSLKQTRPGQLIPLAPRFLLRVKRYVLVLSFEPVYAPRPLHIRANPDSGSRWIVYHVPTKVHLPLVSLILIYAPYVAIALKSFTDGTFAPFVVAEVSTIFTLNRENNLPGEYVYDISL